LPRTVGRALVTLGERGHITLADIAATLAGLDVQTSDFGAIARFQRDAYTRLRIHRCFRLECLLLCWLPGQSTPIHDHGGAFGAVRVLMGVLRERRYDVAREHDAPRPTATALYANGGVLLAGREVVHDLTACGDRPVMTLHIYAPNLLRMRTFASMAHA
jgi:predicted metal-dependent enzyme (double-stranded beta helix superfamily)